MAEPSNLQIEADFRKDWETYLREELATLGIQAESTREVHELAISFLNARQRRIREWPREVRASRELYCPPQHRRGLDAITTKGESRTDLTPHLSTAVLRTRISTIGSSTASF